MFLGLPLISNADIGGLNPCKDSEVFQKRLAKTVKKLENRLKNTKKVLLLKLQFSNKLIKQNNVLQDTLIQIYYAEMMVYHI